MRAVAFGVLLFASLAGVLDGFRTREEANPQEVDLATLDPSEFAYPRYVTLRARMAVADAIPHAHLVPSGKQTKTVERFIIPLATVAPRGNPLPTVALEVDRLVQTDGTVVLPYREDAQRLLGWLGPQPPCWSDDLQVDGTALLLNHRPASSDVGASWMLTLLPLIAMALMLVADKRAAARTAATSTPPPGSFSIVERGSTLGGQGLLLMLAGCGGILLLCASRVMRLDEVGVSSTAVAVVLPLLCVLVWTGYRAVHADYALCIDGLRITHPLTGTIQWIPFARVEGLDWVVPRSPRSPAFRLYLSDAAPLRLDVKETGRQLARHIVQRILERIGPPAMADWDAGRSVEFGAVVLESSSLVVRSGGAEKRIALNDISLVSVEVDTLSIKEKGARPGAQPSHWAKLTRHRCASTCCVTRWRS